jgi:hypothetical protein
MAEDLMEPVASAHTCASGGARQHDGGFGDLLFCSGVQIIMEKKKGEHMSGNHAAFLRSFLTSEAFRLATDKVKECNSKDATGGARPLQC